LSSLQLNDPTGLLIIFVGLLIGSIIKGATGAGLPIVAIPTIAAVYDVRVAVVLLVVPNLITNSWQIYKYKSYNLDNYFARNFAIAGFIGAGIGTLLLAYLPLGVLNILIAVIVFSYVVRRLLRPEFQLAMKTMQRWVFVMGTSAGVLQGAIGLSAPITITFLHAGKLPRNTFVFVASLFFAVMCLIQLPLQLALGLMTWKLAVLSTLVLIPIIIGLPVGEHIGRKISSVVFDRLILLLLTVLATKMLVEAMLTLL